MCVFCVGLIGSGIGTPLEIIDDGETIALQWNATPGTSYDVERSLNASEWESIHSVYGLGQEVSLTVFSYPGSPPNSGSSSPLGKTFLISPFQGDYQSNTLVRGTSSDGPFHVLIPQNWQSLLSGGSSGPSLPPFFATTINEGSPDSYNLAIAVLPLPWQDHFAIESSYDPALLSPAASAALGELTGAYPALQVMAANGSLITSSAVTTSAPSPGSSQQFRLRSVFVDSDGDLIPDWIEFQLGTNPYSSDTDGDGITDGDEAVHGTDPTNADSDNDGLNDAIELATGTNPMDSDTDGDGYSDGYEDEKNTDPNSDSDHPGPLFGFRSAKRDLVYLYYTPSEDFDPGGYTTLNYFRRWDPANGLEIEPPPIEEHVTFEKLDDKLAQNVPFPKLPVRDNDLFTAYGSLQPIEHLGASRTVPVEDFVATHVANLDQQALWLEVQPKREVPVEAHFWEFRYEADDTGSFIHRNPLEIQTIRVPAGDHISAPLRITPKFDGHISGGMPAETPKAVRTVLHPIELAPEVLRVNTDFDEGRIDSATGVAVPDALGDTPSLQAERDHLDGSFETGEIVTDDLHPGWFGPPRRISRAPGFLPWELDNGYDGAVVTIRKIVQDDQETGYPESGNVRFWAVWEEDSDIAQEVQTYDPGNPAAEPTNLVGSVYGSAASIPQDATFWIEGITPGTITLEWRMQKGADIDISFQQTFLIATQLSKEAWQNEIVYQFRLETDDVVDLADYIPDGPASFFPANRKYIKKTYEYYGQTYLQNPHLHWIGLGKMAGATVYGGLTDAHYSGVGASPSGGTLFELARILMRGHLNILNDIAWQHHAFASSGIWAIQFVDDEQGGDSSHGTSVVTLDDWNLLYQGIEESDPAKFAAAASRIARREQEFILSTTFSDIRTLGLDPALPDPPSIFARTMSENAKNPVPGGMTFHERVPGGDISFFPDRWQWIAGAGGGMLEIWESAGVGGRAAHVSTPFIDLALQHVLPGNAEHVE